MSKNWLWLDLETTGLNEHAGQVLEVAALVADDGANGTFGVLDTIDMVVLPYAPLEMDDYVRAMHTKNGLLALVESGSGVHVTEAETALCAFVARHFAADDKIVLAGGSVHFDLRWCKRHFPRFSARLSYRVFDVSTLKAAARTWRGEFADVKDDTHRALGDAAASLKEARTFRDML